MVPAPVASSPTEVALFRLSGQLLIDDDIDSEHWYDACPVWPSPSPGGLRGTLEQWQSVAGEALESGSRAYEKKYDTLKGDAVKKALDRQKTVADKIASLTLIIQESPLHHLDEIYTLLELAQKKVRRERRFAVDALKDLFINNLLPERRLIQLQNRDFQCAKGALSKRHLAYALFESELKTIYQQFLDVLQESSADNLLFVRELAVQSISDLLVAKPEGEKTLLAMLVNKLGDPEGKVSAKASYCLSQLIQKHHPQMRTVVVKEVEHMLRRPNVTRKTQYYAVTFLNQIYFRESDVELARHFVRMYMELFTKCLQEDRETVKSVTTDKVKKRIKRTIKKGKVKKVKVKVEVKDREAGAAAKESRLMGALLNGVNRAFPYTKPEENEESYESYYNALFHVAHAKSLHPATQALAFILQVTQSNSTHSDRFYRALYSRIFDAAVAGDSTQAAFLNLLFRAIKGDPNSNRKKACVKRLMQAGLYGSAAFAGACTVVSSEVFAGKDIGILKSFVSLPERDDEDEHFVDADKDSDNDGDDDETTNNGANANGKVAGKSSDTEDKEKKPDNEQRYNAKKRDPQYAGAERSSLWEAVGMCCHYHPSISLFASQICRELKNVKFNGDPLKDFSDISFLDKFSYKKAKNRIAKSLYGRRAARYNDDPLANSQEFQKLIESGELGVDSKFFAKFFSSNPERVQKLKGAEEVEEEGSDVDSEDEAFEQAMEAEMRRLGADEGFFADRKGMPAGDIDDEDEDELKAFEKAFGKDMQQSDDDGEDMVVEDGENVVDDDGDDELDDGMMLDASDALLENGSDVSSEEELRESKRERKSRKKSSQSVFAAADDFAEAINNEIPMEEFISAKKGKKSKRKSRDSEMEDAQPSKKTCIEKDSTAKAQPSAKNAKKSKDKKHSDYSDKSEQDGATDVKVERNRRVKKSKR